MTISSFSIPKKLAETRWVEFFSSNSNVTWFAGGIVLKFARGYTPSQIKRIKALRKDKGIFYEASEKRRRITKGLIPLRELNSHHYALVLVFEDKVNDYRLRWVKITDLSIRTYDNMSATPGKLVPRTKGAIHYYAPSIW